MVNKTTINRQHSEIKDLAGQISAYQAPTAVIDNAFSISLLLGQLSGKITMHLQHEDQYVYPYLLSHANGAIRETTLHFKEEMGGLIHDFTNFKTKYFTASKIKENPEGFIREGSDIFRAIIARMNKEDQQLYPLVN